MELEQLAVAIRPRGGWEALDLGFTMARQWWKPLYLAWLSLYLPVALLLHFVLWDYLWLAIALLWWLHPLFERAVLHVVAHAVFDSPPTLRQTLAAAGDWLRPGWFASITLYRAQWARSLMLPVWQLEKQRGSAARDRRRLLRKRLHGHGVWLTVLGSSFVLVIFYALHFIPALLAPVGVETELDLGSLFERGSRVWTWQESACLVLAYSIVEPFYVCGGFALYLNRRATLEAWDIEIALRKLAQRAGRVAAVLLLACFLAFGVIDVSPVYAAPQAQPTSPAEVVKQILAEPEFDQYRSGKRWEPREKEKEKPENSKFNFDFLFGLGEVVARVAQVLAWVAAGIVLFWMLRAAIRHWGWGGRRVAVESYQPPVALFGLDLRPQSLPEDIAGTASALARAGQLREALSLLYRGALSALVHSKQVVLAEGDTEGDCLVAANPVLQESGRQYFARLVDAWRGTAYAKRLPLTAQIEELCAEWNAHFRAARDPQ